MNIHAVRGISPAEVEIAEATVERLVLRFYAKLKVHPVLGPICDSFLGVNWEPHMVKMCDYWSSVALDSARYHNDPMLAYMRVAAIRPEHFDLWIELWREAAREVCPPAAAAVFIEHAERSLGLELFPNVETETRENSGAKPESAFTAKADHPEQNVESLRLAPGADIPKGVYATIFGAYAWMIFVLWTALNADGEAVFVAAISAVFLAMYVGIPATLSALGRKSVRQRILQDRGFTEFLDRDFSTYTGTISGREAALQILTVPVFLALGMTVIALIITHAQ